MPNGAGIFGVILVAYLCAVTFIVGMKYGRRNGRKEGREEMLREIVEPLCAHWRDGWICIARDRIGYHVWLSRVAWFTTIVLERGDQILHFQYDDENPDIQEGSLVRLRVETEEERGKCPDFLENEVRRFREAHPLDRYLKPEPIPEEERSNYQRPIPLEGDLGPIRM